LAWFCQRFQNKNEDHKKDFLFCCSCFRNYPHRINSLSNEAGKNDTWSTTQKLRRTDAPIDADSVNVDIRQVSVNFRHDSTGRVDLNTDAGIYDLLGL